MKNNYFHTVNSHLNPFDPVSLDKMDGVKLMDRTDVKFILSIDNLAPILEALKDSYRVLAINNHRIFSYRTDYYDTPELNMFVDHHNGKLNRYKIRQREYIESSLRFLEVKFKSNKGRVLKERIERPDSNQHIFAGFIRSHSPYNPKDLKLTLINRFNRFTLVDNSMHERVTCDFNLSFNDSSKSLMLNGLVIIEVKQKKHNNQGLIFKVLKNKGIRPSPMSKYCLGISLLNENSKLNNFKKTILLINKLSHVELSA